MDLHLDLERAAGRDAAGARRERAARRDPHRAAGAGHAAAAEPGAGAQLGVSRGVVVEAYAQLAAEGYLHARQGAGTTVARAATGARRRPRARALAPAIRHDLSPFVPALERVSARRLAHRAEPRAADGARRAPGAARRGRACQSCARRSPAYLARSRGVRGGADQVIVCNGLRQGLGLLWSALAAARRATGGRRGSGLARDGADRGGRGPGGRAGRGRRAGARRRRGSRRSSTSTPWPSRPRTSTPAAR